MSTKKLLHIFIFLLVTYNCQLSAQTIPTPKEHFGFNIGDDYMLANYTQAEAYCKKVAEASDRVVLQPIGKTEEGRNQYIIIISDPQNIMQLSKYQSISQKLARAEGLTDEEARKLSIEGKSVVWIDGGLHATETVGSHQLIETLYQLASRNDDETKRILKDDIILLAQVNPDGQELVANWYMKDMDVKKRGMDIPKLYEKYIGHDNNRDFYMNNMSESKNISRILYIDWMPQILYNHHQSAPAGAVVAGAPYRDPFNFVYDPLLVTGIDAMGAAMINRLNAEGKPGYTRLSGSVFSTWWNGGLRTTAYFHNIIGLLTEIIGSPTPSEVPLVPERLMPNGATPNPVTPQKWHFRKSIDYSVSLNYAILDYASRYKDHLLYNMYRMGKNSIEKGSKDHWTLYPKYIDSVKALISRNEKGENRRGRPSDKYFDSVFHSAENRDPRGFIIPSDQTDFYSAVKFVNALIESGIKIERASKDFTVNGTSYPAGSYIVKTDQAYRPHVIDMFEPQDHPNDFQYPGGPPVRPYDAAGWTLAYQMGIKFDRILTGFDGPFETIPYGQIQAPPASKISMNKSGYVLSAAANNSYIAVNDLLKNGVNVFRLLEPGSGYSKGDFYIDGNGYATLTKAATTYGVQVKSVNKVPTRKQKLQPSRIALFDQYGGSMPSGWTRWLMEQFHFPFKVIYPQEIDNGNLNSKYDVILFIDAYMPTGTRRFNPRQPKPEDIPAEFRSWLGSITKEQTIPALQTFLENGGHVVTVGNSSSLAYLLDLPVKNALTETTPDGDVKQLSSNDYFIPGSILTANVDTTQMENSGMKSKADMVFNNSAVFNLNPDAIGKGLRPLAWFGEGKPLKSGWAWGQPYLKEGVVAFTSPVGKGKFYACSTEITFRAQPYGTFKMLFNQLYHSK